MSPYQSVVFIHLLGAVGLFAALAVEAVGLARLRAARDPAEASASLALLRATLRVAPAAMLATLASGMWLASRWGRQPWLAAGLAGLVAMAAAGAAGTLPRLRRALASPRDPVLAGSLRLRLALALGVLALMTFKPATGASLLVLAAAAAVGLAAALVGRDPGPRPRRLEAGALFPARELVSIAGERIALPQPGQLVHLQLRRFAGCPVCSFHLRSFARRHEELAAAGVREVVVFHSPARELAVHAADLPVAVVPDPDKELYGALGTESAARALLDPRAWLPIVRAVLASLWAIVALGRPAPPLAPHGGRLGLPADFLIGGDGRVLASKYGDHVYDQWSVDDVLALARFYPTVELAETGT